MAYCKTCGNALSDGEESCRTCGKTVESYEVLAKSDVEIVSPKKESARKRCRTNSSCFRVYDKRVLVLASALVLFAISAFACDLAREPKYLGFKLATAVPFAAGGVLFFLSCIKRHRKMLLVSLFMLGAALVVQIVFSIYLLGRTDSFELFYTVMALLVMVGLLAMVVTSILEMLTHRRRMGLQTVIVVCLAVCMLLFLVASFLIDDAEVSLVGIIYEFSLLACKMIGCVLALIVFSNMGKLDTKDCY